MLNIYSLNLNLLLTPLPANGWQGIMVYYRRVDNTIRIHNKHQSMYIKRHSNHPQVSPLNEMRRWNMYKSFKKKKLGLVASPLHWVKRLCLLRGPAVTPPVACCQLPADVALNKLFKAVITLGEQILQVPAPWLGMLKHTGRNTPSHIKRHLKISIWIKAISQTQTQIKLHVKSVMNAGMKRRPLCTFMELRSMSFVPGQHW